MGGAVRQARRARATGTTVLVEDLGHPDADWMSADPEYRWGTLCIGSLDVPHSGLCEHPTLGLARAHAAHPEEWCCDCQEERS